MYLVVINPIGLVTSLDLLALPVWRLETRAIEWPGSTTKALALGIAYVNAGTTGFAAIAAINCLVESKDAVDPIAKLGLPGGEAGPMKERLREGIRSLINADVNTKDVDDMVLAASTLVDAYQSIMTAMWGFTPPLAQMGADAKGELQGWKWALMSTKRYSSWLANAAGISVPTPTASAFEPPKVPVAATAAADPLAATDLGIGPPPDENGPPRRPRAKKEPAP